jgi:hypothetical protein
MTTKELVGATLNLFVAMIWSVGRAYEDDKVNKISLIMV